MGSLSAEEEGPDREAAEQAFVSAAASSSSSGAWKFKCDEMTSVNQTGTRSFARLPLRVSGPSTEGEAEAGEEMDSIEEEEDSS